MMNDQNFNPGAQSTPIPTEPAAQGQSGAQSTTSTSTSTGSTPAAAQLSPHTSGGAQATDGSSTAATGDQNLFNKFDIPESVRSQHADLIALILETESMNDDERQYWFQILPIMTDEQVQKLREILDNEKKQLQTIDQEYKQQVQTINSQHVSEWKEFEAKEQREKLQQAEAQAEAEEKGAEDQLLQQLDQM